jgi:Holliday junction resolvase RusA-like endonuclease
MRLFQEAIPWLNVKRQKCFISGLPASQGRSGAKGPDLEDWRKQVAAQTEHLRPVPGPCKITAIFVLPPDRFPASNPYGPDLDNLLKPLFDGMKQTLFRRHPQPIEDACVIQVKASKAQIRPGAEGGVALRIQLVRVSLKDA